MDANDLIKGIEEFFGDILPKACSTAEWSEDSITNAFLWADFCEQIYIKYKNSTSKDKLDTLIHSLFCSIKNNNREICFEDLRRSTDFLCEAFFENPSVENELVLSVLLKVKGNKDSFEAIKDGPDLDSLCNELLEALRPVKLRNPRQMFYFDIKAIIYIEALTLATLHMTSLEEVGNYISNCLEELCEDSNKMMQLLSVIMVQYRNAKDIQEFILNWTMHKLLSEKNCPLAHYLWKRPSELRVVSLNSTDFLKFYLEFLTDCSSTLTSEIMDNETVWVSRSSDEAVLSFDEILSHFRSLLAVDDDISEATKKHLITQLDSEPNMEIWKEIFSRVT